MQPDYAVRPLIGWLFCVVYFLAGVAALSYEVLWTRMFTLLFGVSIFGIAVTVAGFMAGLGAGSLIGAWVVRRLQRPLLWFALIEGGIALFAFWLPVTVSGVDKFITTSTAHASLGLWYATEVVAVFLLMSLPAFAMGIGFAVAIAFFRGTTVRLGFVYGLNTLGGMIGAIVPLVLLPVFGWMVSLRLAAILGFAVAAMALILHGLARTRFANSVYSELGQRPSTRHLIAYAAIGAAALMLQVGWVRLYGMLLLRTEYVLAILLAVFLAGIGVGSLAAQRARKEIWLVLLPIVGGAWAVVGLWLVPALGATVDGSSYRSLDESLADAGLWITFLTFPVTFCLGAWLPLIVTALKQPDDVGIWYYGANSVGAAIGALAAAFVLMPLLGSPATIVLAAVLLAVASLAWVESRWFRVVPFVLLGAGLPVWAMPEVASLLPRSQANTRDMLVHEDAIAVTHVVDKVNGERLLLADLQRMDASSDPTAVAAQANQARLPLLLHRAPKSVLFLGLGTGVTASGSLPFPELTRVAVELSEGSVVAARDWFGPVNGSVLGVTKVIRDDARRFLRVDESFYDVIIGDLFHPDLAGRSALLSLQQFERARGRLSQGGVFVQWIALNQFDGSMLDVVLRTFRAAFPNGVIFVDGFRLALVGSNHGVLAADLLANVSRMDAAHSAQATGGEGEWTWLGRYWGRINVAAGPVQDEWSPMIEFHLPAARYKRAEDLPRLLGKLLIERPGVSVAARELGIAQGDIESFERAYFAVELGLRSWVAGLSGDASGQSSAARLAYQANPLDRWAGFSLADQLVGGLSSTASNEDKKAVLEHVLAIRADHVEALRALMHLAEQTGDSAESKRLRGRLALASPFDAEVRGGGLGR